MHSRSYVNVVVAHIIAATLRAAGSSMLSNLRLDSPSHLNSNYSRSYYMHNVEKLI